MKDISRCIPLYRIKTLQRLVHLFAQDIRNSLDGKESSLAGITYSIPPINPAIEKGKTVVIGGTNSLSANWSVRNGKISFSRKRAFATPNFLDHAFFSDALLDKDVPSQNLPIGFNLAISMKSVLQNNSVDGVLAGGVKEIGIDKRYQNQPVAETFRRLCNSDAIIPPEIAVGNDTICLLLAGLSLPTKPGIAGVVGTGVNFSLYVRNEQGEAKKQDTGTFLAVNLESGRFSKVLRSSWDEIIDKGSKASGCYLTEKQVSGRYLYRLYNKIAESYDIPLISSTQDLDNIMKDASAKGYILAHRIIERSAQLVAMQLAGILEFQSINSGEVYVLMEGSLFWKGYKYKKYVLKWLRQLAPGVIVVFQAVRQSNLVGGAMLARTIQAV